MGTSSSGVVASSDGGMAGVDDMSGTAYLKLTGVQKGRHLRGGALWDRSRLLSWRGLQSRSPRERPLLLLLLPSLLLEDLLLELFLLEELELSMLVCSMRFSRLEW